MLPLFDKVVSSILITLRIYDELFFSLSLHFFKELCGYVNISKRTTDDLAVNLAYTLMKPGAPLKLFYSCVFVDGDINTTFLTRLARKV